MIKSAAERKRILEVMAMIITSVLLIELSRLETRLFELSEALAKNQEFFTTVVYFGLINFNVILVLVLSFLLFRNVAKLVVERRRGVFGSNLRAKLVAALMFFALAPTVLLSYISSRYIITSFDEWFSEKVSVTMHQTREAGAKVYKQDQRRLESLARIALQKIKTIATEQQFFLDQASILPGQLKGFDTQYGLDNVRVYDADAKLLWSAQPVPDWSISGLMQTDSFLMEALDRFSKETDLPLSTVMAEDQQDVVKAAAPIIHPVTHQLIGVVITETRFETQILKSIESIQQSFANLRPSAQLIKLSYLILLAVMALVIVFSAVWLGFYVARGITGPIQSLAEGTREVALGNYSVTLTARTEDETGQLVRSFNMMTKDLQRHRHQAEEARGALINSNEELDQRRKYMEVVLKNITAGVIAVSPDGCITSVNHAAESLLQIRAAAVVGLTPQAAFASALYEHFWRSIEERLGGHDSFNAQIDLDINGSSLTLLVDGSRIADEDGEDLGVVVVFDDATEQVKVQRVAAWREVAKRIAHEIKNPVTPIKLSAQRLLRRFNDKFSGEDKEVFEDCLSTILKQVDLLRDLVNEFSKFSRLPQVHLRLASINDVISDVVKLYQMSYPHIEFARAGLESLPDIQLDKDQMNRVFVNIIANAVAAVSTAQDATETPPVGRIELRGLLLKNLNTVRIEVVDNGIGIPAHLRDRVVEPYFSTKEGGTGLGLAIVNQIVTDHRGYLRIVENEPAGTIIVIELPVGDAQVRRV